LPSDEHLTSLLGLSGHLPLHPTPNLLLGHFLPVRASMQQYRTIEIRPPFFVGTPGLDPAVVVQDVQLSVSNNLSCSFIFNFMPPVDNFKRSYPDLVTWFSSISCAHSNVTVFHSIFGVDKEVHQSIEPDERSLASCHASPRFEWILSFSEVGSAGQIPLVNFSVQSGSIRKYLLSLSDCVSPSPGGNMITFLCA